jgi:hypothetical protein
MLCLFWAGRCRDFQAYTSNLGPSGAFTNTFPCLAALARIPSAYRVITVLSSRVFIPTPRYSSDFAVSYLPIVKT